MSTAESSTATAAATGGGFGAGPDDAVIVPLVVLAVALRKLGRALLTLLIRLLDYAFPILLQLMRFPLFTLRIIGDGLAALARGVVSLLPVGGDKRAAWRTAIAEWWAWLRQKISYKAFEEAVHHWFEDGMAWVFRTCKALTPGRALFVIFLALVWFPISFVLATGMHAILFAKATTWPAWTQLLHPVATVIAKTKLLVLPVYPAAWPQAKKHSFVQGLIEAWRRFIRLRIVQKTGHRYRQAEEGATRLGDAMGRTAIRTGLSRASAAATTWLNDTAVRFGRAMRDLGMRVSEALAKTPLIGTVMAHYAHHYERAGQRPAEPLSEKVGDFFARWSVKFTAEYYEAKEKAEAAKRDAAASTTL